MGLSNDEGKAQLGSNSHSGTQPQIVFKSSNPDNTLDGSVLSSSSQADLTPEATDLQKAVNRVLLNSRRFANYDHCFEVSIDSNGRVTSDVQNPAARVFIYVTTGDSYQEIDRELKVQRGNLDTEVFNRLYGNLKVAFPEDRISIFTTFESTNLHNNTGTFPLNPNQSEIKIILAPLSTAPQVLVLEQGENGQWFAHLPHHKQTIPLPENSPTRITRQSFPGTPQGYISRNHLELTISEGSITIKDTSTNGTEVRVHKLD